ncbi:MAG: N-acetyltransferase [Woeseia sp.]
MIERLGHCSESVAKEIHRVFQAAYKVEAEQIGVTDFPPLKRSAEHIRATEGDFLGCWSGVELTAVMEYVLADSHLSIDSLVVHPDHFRRGLASSLLQFRLAQTDWQTADVETAAQNGPAIALYEKFGFSFAAQWTTKAGIDKVRLSLDRANAG